jgi:DNA adenine methylase
MSDEQHKQLAELLHSVKAKVALSGYHCELMDNLYRDWHCYEAPPRLCHSVKQVRREVLWTNYDIQQVISSRPQANSSNGTTQTLQLTLNDHE